VDPKLGYNKCKKLTHCRSRLIGPKITKKEYFIDESTKTVTINSTNLNNMLPNSD
jgi:hypothetical protein